MKTIWISVFGLALLGGLTARSEAAVESDGNRFLFIVETSSATGRLEHGGRQPAFDLIFSGISGQMRTGDTFGVWTFNEKVIAGVYPKQFWDPELNLGLARQATLFLKDQPYEKKGHLEAVTSKVLGVVRGIKDINVFIISDPGTRLPDDSLGQGSSKQYGKIADQARRARMPVVTTVVARNGSISNWFVTVGGEPIRLPPFAVPEHPKVVAKPVAPPPVARVETTRPPRAPIIMKRQSVAPLAMADGAQPRIAPPAIGPRQSGPQFGTVLSSSADIAYVSSVQTNLAAVPPATNQSTLTAPVTASESSVPPSSSNTAVPPPVPTLNPAPPPAIAQPAPIAPATIPQSPRVETPNANPVAIPPAAAQPGLSEVKPSLSSEQPRVIAPDQGKSAISASPSVPSASLKVHARERTNPDEANSGKTGKASAPNAVVTPATPDQLFSPLAMVVIGLLLLAVAASLTALFVQRFRRPAEASFITQSLDRQ